MQKILGRVAVAAISLAFATEAMATEWNVSLWGKRRAFTENTEKLAELVAERNDLETQLATDEQLLASLFCELDCEDCGGEEPVPNGAEDGAGPRGVCIVFLVEDAMAMKNETRDLSFR